ncbi:hypothetical protein [Dyadobacter psychrotolerans]|uniref:Uncharacterized protein n=1 Tax=Dyadobacter psychrotolerans TaxID=2541721 RepID=A0A4R5DG03_9BACT|nr:hypothetical protein [Dyadobacter psychrotolerans]TDE10831.1 hypothetical protein E0F88_27545 [Dyadobacter psychrotolerans]
MMKYECLFIMLLTCAAQNCLAQGRADQNIQDSIIGWWANNRFDHLKPQTDPVAKRKEAVLNEIVKWMKTSYTPVGGLGTSSRYIGSRRYGVNFLVWNVSHDKQWTEPDGRFKPIPEENTRFDISVNQLYGAFPIHFINTGREFYFTIQPDGYAVSKQVLDGRKGADARIHPNAYKYITWINEWCTVYLAPDNKLPWTPVSTGELLEKAEQGLAKVLADKRKEAAAQWPSNQKTQQESVDQFIKTDLEKYRSKIQLLKSRYSNSLHENALIRSMQPNMYSFDTDPDLFQATGFEKGLKQFYQVFKLDSASWAKANDINPLWVAVSFPFENKESGNQLYELFTSLSENINYDYIYNYFFNPESIKAKAYSAANAGELKARLEAYRHNTAGRQKTIARKQTHVSSNMVLFDDFSQESPGAKPAGWHFSSIGKAHTVSKVEGQNGNWLKLGYGNQLTSATLESLPENFNIEYDILTSGFDGRWGANITMELKGSKKGSDGLQYASFLKTSITAGNQSALEAKHDYRGEVNIELVNTPSKMDYNDKGGYFTAPQSVFTNSKRKVHVQLLKKGGSVALFLDGKELTNSLQFKTKYGKPCGDCSIPEGITYNSFTIRSFTQDADLVDCYIGNIKISSL